MYEEMFKYDSDLLQSYKDFREGCPTFDPVEGYLVAIQDDSGNTMELVGAVPPENFDPDDTLFQFVMDHAFARLKDYSGEVHPHVLRNGRLTSYTVQ